MLPPIVRPVPATQPEVPTGTFIVRVDAVSEKIFVAPSMTVLGTDKLTVASLSHRSNALSPMLVALLGMVMLVRLCSYGMRNPDAGDAVGNGDARQASAVSECVIPDAGDASWEW